MPYHQVKHPLNFIYLSCLLDRGLISIASGFSFSGLALNSLAAHKRAYESLPASANITCYPLLKGSLGSNRLN